MIAMLQTLSKKIQEKRSILLREIVFIWVMKDIEYFLMFSHVWKDVFDLEFVNIYLFLTNEKNENFKKVFKKEKKNKKEELNINEHNIEKSMDENKIEEINIQENIEKSFEENKMEETNNFENNMIDLILLKKFKNLFISLKRPDIKKIILHHSKEKYIFGVYVSGPINLINNVEFIIWSLNIGCLKQFHLHKENFYY
jgi:hypothetical protein